MKVGGRRAELRGGSAGLESQARAPGPGPYALHVLLASFRGDAVKHGWQEVSALPPEKPSLKVVSPFLLMAKPAPGGANLLEVTHPDG